MPIVVNPPGTSFTDTTERPSGLDPHLASSVEDIATDALSNTKFLVNRGWEKRDTTTNFAFDPLLMFNAGSVWSYQYVGGGSPLWLETSTVATAICAVPWHTTPGSTIETFTARISGEVLVQLYSTVAGTETLVDAITSVGAAIPLGAPLEIQSTVGFTIPDSSVLSIRLTGNVATSRVYQFKLNFQGAAT